MTNLADHLFVSDTDGALFDTRLDQWSSKPLRQVYRRHFRDINTIAELKATLRAGQYAWPGGYPVFFITSDGATLSFDSVKEELHQIIWSIENQVSDGWRVVACDINYEFTLFCDHSGEQIESAYVECK